MNTSQIEQQPPGQGSLGTYQLPSDDHDTPIQKSPVKLMNNIQEYRIQDDDELNELQNQSVNANISYQQNLQSSSKKQSSPKKIYEQNTNIQNSIQSQKTSSNMKQQPLYYEGDKENSDYLSQQYNIPQNMISQQYSAASSMKKSNSQLDIIQDQQNSFNQNPYDQDQFEDNNSQGNQSYIDNMTQNTDINNNYNNGSQSTTNKKKIGKRSQSKDVKIIQTMKAYFPQLAPTDPKKAALLQQASNPMLQKVYGGVQNGSRSSTQGQGKNKGQHSERIIFVENRRKPTLQADNANNSSTIEYKNSNNRQSIERRNSQINNSQININQKQSTKNNADQLRKNTQLPPINRRSQVQVLDQQQSNTTMTNTGILSPQSNIHMSDTSQLQQQQTWSDKQRVTGKFNYTSTSEHQNALQDLYMVNGVILEGNYDSEQQRQNQQRTDFERKNQEMIQRMQEKKNQEMKMIEEQRRKLQKKQEKLKNMILKQAADVREKKLREEEETKKKQLEEPKEQKKTPKKIKPYIPQPPQQQIMLKQISAKDDQKQETLIDGEEVPQEEDEDKKQMNMLKKYYRSRYATFLKTIAEKNKKRDEEMEVQKRKEEKRKAKLQEEIGVKQVQSRFMEDVVKLSKEVAEKMIIEEVKKKPQTSNKRGSSIVGIKSMTSTSNFNQTSQSQISNDSTSVSDIQKIYINDGQKRNRSNSKSQKRAMTPKVKKSKRVIVMPIDEKTEEEFEKEQKAKKEAAEKIKQRQQKYLQELQDRKEKESLKMEEEKKKREKQIQLAREQAKQNFEKVNNQPGLMEKQLSKADDEESTTANDDTEKKKKKKQKKQEAAGGTALESFLERNNPKKVIFPNITDMATWKRKYKVDDNVKVFICTGGYPDIKRALKKRGWVENKDATSPCFDFKWVLKSKDIDHNTLNDTQLVNHFNKATAITTKVGLCHNLKNLIWFNNVDIDTFYPRCFDLAMQEDLDDYIQEFKAVKAESFVKVFVREMRETMGEKTTVTDKVLKVALKVCEKRLKELDELIDDPNAFSSLVTEEEWAILGADEHNPESLAKQKHENWLAKNEVMQQEKKKQDKKANAEKKKKKKKKVKKPKTEDEEEEYDNDFETDQKANDDGDEDIIDDEDEDGKGKVDQDIDLKIMNKHPEFKRAVKILEDLKAKYPQFNLNGERNIWIVKPAGSSRGRGIVLYKQLIEILDLCKQKESQYIAQKYIENSLIVKSRKFDIRQWVLVTDWNPLTVWVYAEPYFRFPASDYNAENILDRFIHLTNNSVAKYAEGSQAKVSHEIEGNMWCHEEMRNYLQEEYGWDVWEDKLKEQSQNIIINCLESVQDMFECKPGCFELFGFDLMIDEDFNMWLIEVNSSPAMDYSTSVTERLVKLVLEDTIKVVVDYASAKKKSKVDTGLFELVYKAQKIVDKPINSFGLNLVCEGKKMAPNKVVQY